MPMTKCLICGSNGDDLVFKFYCSNPSCQNFHKSKEPETYKVSDDIVGILRNWWVTFNLNETEEEFIIKFFATGGRFKLSSEGGNKIIATKPQWLKERMESKT